MRPITLLSFILVLGVTSAQTPPKTVPKTAPKAEQGFAVAPIIAADTDCARDYSKAFELGGLELRKRLAELEAFHCIDSTAIGVFKAISMNRKDVSASTKVTAFFREVRLLFDEELTMRLAHQQIVNRPPKSVYYGWIPDADFVTSEAAAEKLVRQKIRR